MKYEIWKNKTINENNTKFVFGVYKLSFIET